jgi:hypothetical protein
MSHDQGWFLNLLDDRGDCECFAGAGGAEQYLVLEVPLDSIHELADGFRLVTGWLEGGAKFEVHRMFVWFPLKNRSSILSQNRFLKIAAMLGKVEKWTLLNLKSGQ